MSPTCPRGRGGCSAPHPARPRLSRPSPVRSFCCLYFVATFLSWKEEIAGALQAEAGGSPADSHLSPLTPTRPTETCLGREAAIRGEGGPSGWTLRFFGPVPRAGKFFLLCLVCYNLMGVSGGTSIPGPPRSGPQHGSAPTWLWSSLTPEVLSSVPPSPSGEA